MLETIRARLVRVTSSGRFIPEIDGLRFVAIIAVMLFHMNALFFTRDPTVDGAAWAFIGEVASKGWFGVQLFFVLSGFILALPFARAHFGVAPPPALRRYFKRRLTRLEPPYLISLFVYLAWWAYASGQPLRTTLDLLPNLAASAVYLHTPVYGYWSQINHVAWTLEIEVQFYILAPLLCQLFRLSKPTQRRAVFIALIVLASVSNQLFTAPILSLTLLGQIRYFLLGLLLADVYSQSWRRDAPPSLGWGLVGVIAWASIPFAIHPHWLAHHALPPLIFIAYAGALRGVGLRWLFSRPWITAIGGMCYTIYLYHILIIGRVTGWGLVGAIRPGEPLRALLQLGGVILITLLTCALLFVLFERPFMDPRWVERMKKRRAPNPPPTE